MPVSRLRLCVQHPPSCMAKLLRWYPDDDLLTLGVWRRIYDLYTDFVLKNPFYEVEMPVRCELFDTNLFATVGMLHRRWGVATA